MTSPAQTSDQSVEKRSSRGAGTAARRSSQKLAPAGEGGAQRVGHLTLGRGVGGRGPQKRRVLAEVDRHPSASDAAGARAHPHHLAAGGELVEAPGP